MLNRLLDFIFPVSTCALCKHAGTYTTKQPWCTTCTEELEKLQTKYEHCNHCGRFLLSPDNLCCDCKNRPFPYSARAALPYEDKGIKAIHALKFLRDRRLASAMAAIMADVISQNPKVFSDCELIIPVPLSPDRMKKRGFNQSFLLAEELAHQLNLPCKSLLSLSHPVPVQHTLSKPQREHNLSAALQIKNNILKEQCVLLVDDIMTTGSTLSACTQVLKRAGARDIKCICWSAGISRT